MADVLGTQRNGTGGIPHEDARLVNRYSGQFGVSDERRAQLSQLEHDAGVEHEAADETVPFRKSQDGEQAAGLASQPAVLRLGHKP
jgi:hypothetical protein